MAPFAAACDLPFASIALDGPALRQALLARGPGPNLIEIRVP
jgi:acetolactate synthase-1/2/3 large subunit